MAPPLASLVDDFSTINSGVWNSSTEASIVGGQVVIVPTTAYPAIWTVGTYDLTNSYGGIELVSPPNIGNGSTSAYLAVGSAAASSKMQILWNAANNIHVSWFNASNVETSLVDVAYNPVSHRYWRIAESNGTLYAMTSPDAATWTSLASVTSTTTGITLTSAGASVGTGFSGTEPNPGLTIFDNFNVLPLAQLRVPIKSRQVP